MFVNSFILGRLYIRRKIQSMKDVILFFVSIYTLPLFWDQTVRCPVSGRPLKIKELLPVQFTKVDDEEDNSKKMRYMCPITHDIITNTTRCAYLKTR